MVRVPHKSHDQVLMRLTVPPKPRKRSNHEVRGVAKRADRQNDATNKKQPNLKQAFVYGAQKAAVHRFNSQGVPLDECFTGEHLVLPKNPKKTMNAWLRKSEQGEYDRVAPGHFSSRGVDHPELAQHMLLVVECHPRITLAGLYAQTRKSAVYAAVCAAAGKANLSAKTLQRYWKQHVQPRLKRKQQAADRPAAEAFIIEFQMIVDSDGITMVINIDESLWYFRYPGKPAAGTMVKIDGPAVGMVMTSWSNGSRSKVTIATPCASHHDVRWESVDNLVKSDSPTYWVSSHSIVDHIRHQVMPVIPDGECPMLVLDNCPTHACGLAMEAAWAEYMGAGGPVLSADGTTVELNIPRSFVKPSEARAVGTKSRIDTTTGRTKDSGPDYDEADVENILMAEVYAKYKPWSDRLRMKGMKIILNDGIVSLRILFLPPNTSSLLQPCDLSIFGPLKKKFREKLAKEYEAEPGERLWEDYLKGIQYSDALKYLNQYSSELDEQQVKKGWGKLCTRPG